MSASGTRTAFQHPAVVHSPECEPVVALYCVVMSSGAAATPLFRSNERQSQLLILFEVIWVLNRFFVLNTSQNT